MLFTTEEMQFVTLGREPQKSVSISLRQAQTRTHDRSRWKEHRKGKSNGCRF